MTVYRAILPHPIEPRLLMLQAHGELRLPQWYDSTQHEWQMADHVNRAVAARFGAETTVLRCMRNAVDPVTGEVSRIYELENHSPLHDLPGSISWVGQQDFEQTGGQDPLVREVVLEWFARRTGAVPERGAPWMRPGWYVQALSWAVARLRDQGISLTGTPDQLRAWERSFLMRLRTDDGNFFFKAAPDVARHEPSLARWLWRHFPRLAPEIIAVDVQRNWLLQREVAGVVMPLVEVREEALWEDAARRLAQLQLESTRHLRELQHLGCPNRSLDVLAHRIPRLVTDAQAMLLGQECGLTRAEIDHVATLGPTLLTLCEELAHFGLPDALEHGDLYAASILMTMNGPVFMDWSDSSLSHPFFSAFLLVRDAMRMLPEASAESRRRIRDAYLEPWQAIASPDLLHRAFDIAWVLAPVHLAAVAHAELLPAAGYRWEIECLVPSNLRSVLQLLLEENP